MKTILLSFLICLSTSLFSQDYFDPEYRMLPTSDLTHEIEYDKNSSTMFLVVGTLISGYFAHLEYQSNNPDYTVPAAIMTVSLGVSVSIDISTNQKIKAHPKW